MVRLGAFWRRVWELPLPTARRGSYTVPRGIVVQVIPTPPCCHPEPERGIRNPDHGFLAGSE